MRSKGTKDASKEKDTYSALKNSWPGTFISGG